jgi:hypothetical protein
VPASRVAYYSQVQYRLRFDQDQTLQQYLVEYCIQAVQGFAGAPKGAGWLIAGRW